MDRNILFLYELGKLMKSKEDTIVTSSIELGHTLGISQQSASRYLRELESRALIRRNLTAKGQEIQITSQGFDTLNRIYLNLKEFIEGKTETGILEGEVVAGIGEGAYYVEKYCERINKALGFKPFFGTLNLRIIGTAPALERYAKRKIDGFKRGKRTFGEIKVIPAKIHLNKKTHDCFLIMPGRKYHGNEIEILDRINLREKFDLRDGDRLRIEFQK